MGGRARFSALASGVPLNVSSVVGVSSGTPPPPAFAERRPEASGGAVPRPLPSTLSHARGHGCARSGVQGGRPCPRERTALRTRRAAGRGPQPVVRQTLRDLRRPTLARVRAPGWVFLLSLRPAGHRIPWPPSSGMARGATLPGGRQALSTSLPPELPLGRRRPSHLRGLAAAPPAPVCAAGVQAPVIMGSGPGRALTEALRAEIRAASGTNTRLPKRARPDAWQ